MPLQKSCLATVCMVLCPFDTPNPPHHPTPPQPVWNVPMGGTLYFLVAMRASNADRTCGPELDSYQISIDGDVVAGRQGIVIANSSVPGDDVC